MDQAESKEIETQERASSIASLTQAWAEIQKEVVLRPIGNELDLARMRIFADMLVDTFGDDDTHCLYSLYELALDLIERWESEHVLVPSAPPREVLRFLLEQNNLKQKDIADIASPTLVSDILAGRRQISKRLARALASRFRVDIALFI